MSCEPVGVWVPLPNVGTPCVKDIVNFSVDAYNKEIGATEGDANYLTLNRIISGSFKEINDNTIQHKFVIEATDGNGVVDTYQPEVLVVEKGPGKRERTLLSFPRGYQDQNGQFWTKIPDIYEDCVTNVSKFAVEQHNKDADDNLVYVSTTAGWYYEVDPYSIRFDLRIDAKDCFGRWRNYAARVLEEKPITEKIRHLEYFKAISRK